MLTSPGGKWHTFALGIRVLNTDTAAEIDYTEYKIEGYTESTSFSPSLRDIEGLAVIETPQHHNHHKLAALQSTSYRRINQSHFYFTPLCIFVLLYLNLYGDLVKDRDGDVFVLRRRDDQRIVIGIVFWFTFEHDKALDTESMERFRSAELS